MPAIADVTPAQAVSFQPRAQGVRPPDWRWRWADWVVRTHKPMIGRFDRLLPAVLDMRRAILALEQADDKEAAHLEFERTLPERYWAWRLYTDPTLRRNRDLIEAYLLAGTRPDRAAERCGLAGPVGWVYRNVYFDVTKRLDQVGYIMTQAIERGATSPLSEADVGTLWKVVAYTRGEAALEALLCQDFSGRAHAETPTAAGEALDELIRDAVRSRTLMTVKAAGAVRDADVLVGAHLKVREQAAAAGGTVPAAAAETYSMIQALGRAARYGGPAEAVKGLPAAELRAHEQMFLAMGQEVDLKVLDMKYPEARDAD